MFAASCLARLWIASGATLQISEVVWRSKLSSRYSWSRLKTVRAFTVLPSASFTSNVPRRAGSPVNRAPTSSRDAATGPPFLRSQNTKSPHSSRSSVDTTCFPAVNGGAGGAASSSAVFSTM